MNHNKLWKILKWWEYQKILSASWETCMQVKKQQLEHGTTDWFQIRKGVRQGCILSPCLFNLNVEFSSVQSLSCVWLFETPWTAACQASLSITNSWSLLKFISIELVMPSNYLILCCLLLLLPSIFPSIRVFSNEYLFASGGQSIKVSISTSVLPMKIQGWFPLWLTGLTSLLSKRLSRVFSSTTIGRQQSGAQPL